MNYDNFLDLFISNKVTNSTNKLTYKIRKKTNGLMRSGEVSCRHRVGSQAPPKLENLFNRFRKISLPLILYSS